MVGLDEDALTCDFAEVYHVLSWRALPARTAAALAMGLGPDSRIMRKLSGVPIAIDTLLLATIADALHVLVWQRTKDGASGRNRPVLIAEKLLETPAEDLGFDSIEAFHSWRESMLGSEDQCPQPSDPPM